MNRANARKVPSSVLSKAPKLRAAADRGIRHLESGLEKKKNAKNIISSLITWVIMSKTIMRYDEVWPLVVIAVCSWPTRPAIFSFCVRVFESWKKKIYMKVYKTSLTTPLIISRVELQWRCFFFFLFTISSFTFFYMHSILDSIPYHEMQWPPILRFTTDNMQEQLYKKILDYINSHPPTQSN